MASTHVFSDLRRRNRHARRPSADAGQPHPGRVLCSQRRRPGSRSSWRRTRHPRRSTLTIAMPRERSSASGPLHVRTRLSAHRGLRPPMHGIRATRQFQARRTGQCAISSPRVRWAHGPARSSTGLRSRRSRAASAGRSCPCRGTLARSRPAPSPSSVRCRRW